MQNKNLETELKKYSWKDWVPGWGFCRVIADMCNDVKREPKKEPYATIFTAYTFLTTAGIIAAVEIPPLLYIDHLLK